MPKHGSKWRALAATTTAALLFAAPAAAQTSPPAVTVNDPAGARIVTVADVERWTEIARRSNGTEKKASRQTRAQALQLLISSEWIDAEARAQGLVVSEEETQESFEEQRKQAFPREEDYRRFLRRSGQTEADVLDRVRLDLLSNKLGDKVISAAPPVTEEQVDAYIEENGPFIEPEQRDLRVVLTKTRGAAQDARAALERGASWRAVARSHSIDKSTARRGGSLRGMTEAELDPGIRKRIFRARRGQLLGPMKTAYGYYVVKVIRVRKAHPTPRRELRRAVRMTLESEGRQAMLETFVKDFTARWKALTVCAPAYDFSPDCSNWDGTDPTPAPSAERRRPDALR